MPPSLSAMAQDPDVIEVNIHVRITAAELKDLSANPKVIIIAKGVNRYIDVVNLVARFNIGSEPLESSNNNFHIGTQLQIDENSFMIRFEDVLLTTTEDYVLSALSFGVFVPTIKVLNQDVILHHDGDDIIGNPSNDATLDLWINYRIIRLIFP